MEGKRTTYALVSRFSNTLRLEPPVGGSRVLLFLIQTPFLYVYFLWTIHPTGI